MGASKYSDEVKELIKKCTELDPPITDGEIAAMTGRPVDGIKGYLKRANLPREGERLAPKIDKDLVRKYFPDLSIVDEF